MRNKTDATFGQAAQCLSTLSQQGLTSQQMQQLFYEGYLADLARAAKYGMLPSRDAFQQLLGVEEEFMFTLDFSKPLDGMLADCRFDFVGDEYKRGDFKIQDEGVVCFAARFLELKMNPKRALSYLNGTVASPCWELGRIEHALGFAAAFPGYKRNFGAPGTIFSVPHRNRNCMPVVMRENKQRRLEFSWWDMCHRAIAVKPLRKIA